MKNLLALFFISFVALSAIAQAPQKFSYQTVIRNASNQLLVGQTVGIKISILQGSANGSAVYSETHTPQTNANGLATLEIGGGSLLSGNFASINWANGLFFVKTETDPNGGNNYTITNTSQLLSVPYALFSSSATTAGNGVPAGGTNGQTLTICNGIPTWTFDGNCPGSITSLNCNDAIITQSGDSSIYISIPYTGGDGNYINDEVYSVNLGNVYESHESNFQNGDGELTYDIGSFSAIDTIVFSLSVSGQNCSLVIPVNNGSNTLNIETALIPAGTFTMGSPTSEPQRGTDEVQHQVTLSAFRMSKYETSNAQFAAFLNAKNIGSSGIYSSGAYPTEVLVYSDLGSNGLTYTGSQWQPEAGKENYPVQGISWYGAVEFASFAGGRLPTEAEWEYACRGNTTTPFNTGNCLNNNQANYRWNFPYISCTNTNTIDPGQTQAINSYNPNAYGLYNMHGNVYEWCADWYGDYTLTEQINPTGPTIGSSRILRGGNFFINAQICRSAKRVFTPPFSAGGDRGCRLVFAP